MEARMKNPALVLPGAMQALLALGKAADQAGLPKTTVDLVLLRASQINGCSVCVDMHAKDLRKQGESDERLFAVAAWRETPYFTDAERAALALAEEATRLADGGQVGDAVWDEAADHYSEQELAGLLLQIATVNLWNRLNAATRQVAGAAW
ncbi:carboxymuconolactone decarboxylase family protein [Nonomuraea rubra]|uniref:AhpD family alkylhydroperoxidase n=1 Tax=Nonomuraea rubra TaxID=46180 RepID=A0A7X0NZ22_9ACTN|nr:carboxymuconolactone decarboxylase family protein [Nonomuraea rubra]MBB6552264.1 AhpD family alkylhydroperoxidase [Nonomuraea rubra]